MNYKYNTIMLSAICCAFFLLGGVGCKQIDTPVSKPKEVFRVMDADERSMASLFREEIAATASVSRQKRIIVGVSLTAIASPQLLDRFCNWNDVSVIGVQYYVPNIIGEIATFSKTDQKCSVTLANHVVSAIPFVVRQEYQNLQDDWIRQHIEISGIYLEGTAEHLLAHWDGSQEIRAMRLSLSNLSIDLPSPSQPLSKFKIAN